MKHLFLFGLLLSLPFFGFSQGEWNKWYFGQYAGLDFSSGAPVSINGNAMLAPNATITVSDSLGNLLFYSHGYRVWNRNNVIMSNSFLYGDPNLDQPVFCVKSISNDSIFYIISVQDSNWAFTHPPGIFYSILNMHLDGGLGNIPLGENNHPFPNARHATSKLTGTRHQNNKDAWIVVRDDSIAGYRSYKITSSGVDIIPVLSLAHAQSPAWCGGNWGDLKISQDGKKIIATYPVDNIAEYCTFNNQTGNVTSLFRFRLPKYLNEDYYPDYCEFSRKANRVYVYGKSYNGNWGALYQYDANLTDSAQFKQSEQLIYFFSPSQIMNGMQLGKDGKIYVSQNYTGSVGVINFPENSGPACGFQYDAIPLNGNLSLEGLPQFLQKYKAYVTHNGNCPNKDIGFTSDIWPPADSIRWNFGDPSSGPFNISTLANPVHSFSSSGNFTVELYVRHNDNRTDTTWHLVTILPAPQPVLGPDRTICNGDSVKLDAGSWMGATYSWDNLATSQYGIGSSQTYTAKADGNYRVTVTGTNGCSGKDTVLVTVNPNLPVSITVSSSQNPVCAGTAVTFTATPINGGTSPSFLWYINNNPVGANSPIFTYVPINGDLVKCSLTSSDPCTSGNPASSSQLQMIVDNVLLVSVSVSASANNVCAGTSVTFTATPTNPGTTPVYQWKVNGGIVGTNSPNYTYVPAIGDIVSCTLTSSLTCTTNNPASSNQYPVSVLPNLPVSVSVSASANPVCTGTSVTFTATPTNGGNTPSYQWKVNGGNVGTNNPVYTYIPVNGDLVSCVLTSSETCTSNNPASSIQYPVTVNPNLPVSVSITASQNPFCIGASVNFTATPSNGGATPSYQWKVNGVNTGTNSPTFSYNPVSGDLVTCTLTSSAPCVTNNPASSIQLLMTAITSFPAGVSIAASSNPFCPGSTVSFTATPVNGGAGPSYQWKVNGINAGINSPAFSYNPIDGDSIRCVMTSNLPCVSGNPASSNKIILSGTLAPPVSFTACFDTITTINAKPIKLKGGIPLGGTYFGTGVSGGYYYPNIAGPGTHVITYSYTNVSLCTASKNSRIHQFTSSPFTCGNNLIDIRDNKVYTTIQIGSQCWMAEDLNYGSEILFTQNQRDNCIAEKYHNPASSIQHPASVYQWDELMRYDDSPASQGLCPPGWHIPTENEWNTLFTNWVNNAFAGSPLKYSGYSGFNTLLNGAGHMNVQLDYAGFATFYWSSTSHGPYKAWSHAMNDFDPSVAYYPSSRVNAFSVRCLKD